MLLACHVGSAMIRWEDVLRYERISYMITGGRTCYSASAQTVVTMQGAVLGPLHAAGTTKQDASLPACDPEAASCMPPIKGRP
eukprot:1158476-Pelagomonas_calceolata.AAC.5